MVSAGVGSTGQVGRKSRGKEDGKVVEGGGTCGSQVESHEGKDIPT